MKWEEIINEEIDGVKLTFNLINRMVKTHEYDVNTSRPEAENTKAWKKILDTVKKNKNVNNAITQMLNNAKEELSKTTYENIVHDIAKLKDVEAFKAQWKKLKVNILA